MELLRNELVFYGKFLNILIPLLNLLNTHHFKKRHTPGLGIGGKFDLADEA